MCDYMTVKRIGFACKLSELVNGKVSSIEDCNTQTTTLSWLSRQSRSGAWSKLESIMRHNVKSVYNLVKHISTLPEPLRMVRISSEVLPAYTALGWCEFYDSAVRNYLEAEFSKIGELARACGVRLSFHPGQFTVLASDRSEVVENSIREFEYHTDMARWMGYGRKFQDFKINVHISGKLGVSGILAVLPRLSFEARNCITIENEEMSYGLDDCLHLSDHLPIVLDLHHHWIKTGEYIQVNDSRISKVIDSWRGVRPVIHYSVSREDLLCDHCNLTLPNYKLLLESGHKKGKLRAHSDYMWNSAVNSWAKEHWSWADIMVESKAKNLASVKLYEQFIAE